MTRASARAIAAVSEREASRRSCSAARCQALASIGSPTRTSTRERNTPFWSKVSPTGKTRVVAIPRSRIAPSTMRAAPVLSGASAGASWLMPSGNSAIAPPAASSSKQRAKVSSFFAGSAPSSWRR